MASARANVVGNIAFSDYYFTLDPRTQARYKEKALLCGFDPYVLKKSDYSEDTSLLPKTEYPDIVNYLVLQTSWATMKQMKAYKSLDAFNFFVSGWVNTLFLKKVGDSKVVIFARVNHSQRASDTPLKTWLLSEECGTVMHAHCTCMAGLSEACSHVGAILFAIETAVRIRDSQTCTGGQNRWLMPSYVGNIPYLPIADIDFKSAKRKHELLVEENITPTASRNDQGNNVRAAVPDPTPAEKQAFFTNIHEANDKAVILSLIEPFSNNFVVRTDNIPPSLPQMVNNSNYDGLDYDELLDKATDIFDSMTLTPEACAKIESSTKGQASSSTWFKQRSGRITASKLKAAYSTSVEKPSRSLIKSICYPAAHKFSNAATKWGSSNEAVARNAFEEHINQWHTNFSVADSGLHVNPTWPFIGASPDGLVFCDCCGNGLCEIKCPYKHRGDTINECLQDKTFCLEKSEGGLALKKNHPYYFQVQTQLFVCDVDYCDFIIWTMEDLYIERIAPNQEFWDDALTKVTAFFKKGILPELMANYFTRSTTVTNQLMDEGEDDDDREWCFCQTDIEGSMLIGCDSDACTIKWFHMSCMGMEEPPNGEWFCPQCRKV